MKKKNSEMIKVIPLGGVGELGKNMYVVEVEDDLFVLDAGLMFPEDEMLGIDIVIPDFTYLLENKDRIRGIFLTHGHEDHIGALTYILKEIPALPVYGTKLTILLTKIKLKEQDFKGQVDFHIINEDSILQFNNAKVSFFHVNHSIPDSVGICIHTNDGAICYTGDFKFDQSAGEKYRANISKIAKIGDKGVLCLLSDSTLAERAGYTPSETTVVKQLEDIIENIKDRIIYACYASGINSIQRILNAASKVDRKIVLIGKSLQEVYQIAVKNGYIEEHGHEIISVSEIEKYEDHELLILVTGNQGEPLDALQKMIRRAHKNVYIKKGDNVIIAASPHRGGELFLIKTVDLLYRAGAKVHYGNIHVSGHGREEELKLMLNLLRPKFFIPVHGEYRMLVAHKKIAEKIGISSENILIPEKGDIVEIAGNNIKLGGRVTAGNILIDGSGVGDVGNIVLRDRKMLSQDGILIIVVSINRSEKRIVSGPEIISRGFVYVRESEQLMGDATKLVKDIVEKNLKNYGFEWSSVKQEMRDQLNYYLYNQTKRRPMIIPIIMEV